MNDNYFINEALLLAQQAFNEDEVPVGAVIVLDQKIIGRGYNTKEKTNSVIQHAEINAIQDAQVSLNDWRLNGATMYSTLEPCPMCAGAILHARIKRLVFTAFDLKWGAVSTKANLFEKNIFNHNIEFEYIESKQSVSLLKRFFKNKRN